jgi:membrane-associated phospholipid phosphatase
MVSVDERLLRIARTRAHTAAADRAVARFSRIGEHGAVWLALGAAGCALDPSRRGRWTRAAGVVAGTFALNTALKLVVRRPRPELPGLPPLTSTPTRLSFPSAHTSTSFAGARLYARLGLPAAPLYALAAGLAYSRLYLGVHYPSDILAGVALGTLTSRLAGAPAAPPPTSSLEGVPAAPAPPTSSLAGVPAPDRAAVRRETIG